MVVKVNTLILQVDTEQLVEKPIHTFKVDDDTAYEILELLESKGIPFVTTNV
jgi:hypothetical protein